MKIYNSSKSIILMSFAVFFLSVIIVFGIMEFRFIKNVLFNYENSIKQIVVNKTTLFINDLRAVSENGAKKIKDRDDGINDKLKTISTYDYRITNAYIIKKDGTILNSLVDRDRFRQVNPVVGKALQQNGGERVVISGVHNDPVSHLKIVSAVIPLEGTGGGSETALVLDFRIDQYQKEIMQEFLNENYKVAVFDGDGYPVYWPFDKEKLDGFKKNHSKFYDKREQYNVISGDIGQTPWQLYFFLKENNFETFRTITILILVFALYCCLYQLLVEILGVNSARTYFENIDLAVFNKINEGIIITNNSGKIVFANNAAHNIFAERKSTLINIDLKEILGNIEELHDIKDKSRMLTLKMSDRLLETIHSPIVKEGKKLGSLTVIRVNVKEEKKFRIAFSKLLEIIPEGVMFVDKNHEVAAANFMARCYLGNMDKGTSIDVIDPSLAEFIYDNINSLSVRRMELSQRNLLYEIAPVYDDDGVYAGTLVVLLPEDERAAG